MSDPKVIPLYEFAEITWAPMSVVGETPSAFTGKQQVQVFEGQWWEAQVSFPQVGASLGVTLTGFLTGLNGREGRFYLGDPSHTSPAGAAKNSASSPLVNGAGQIGNAISVRNAPVALSNWLLPGDWIQIGTGISRSLHKVTSLADTNAAGQATIEIWPRIRKTRPDGTSIILENAQGIFRLNQDAPQWSVSPPTNYDTGFLCKEAF